MFWAIYHVHSTPYKLEFTSQEEAWKFLDVKNARIKFYPVGVVDKAVKIVWIPTAYISLLDIPVEEVKAALRQVNLLETVEGFDYIYSTLHRI